MANERHANVDGSANAAFSLVTLFVLVPLRCMCQTVKYIGIARITNSNNPRTTINQASGDCAWQIPVHGRLGCDLQETGCLAGAQVSTEDPATLCLAAACNTEALEASG